MANHFEDGLALDADEETVAIGDIMVREGRLTELQVRQVAYLQKVQRIRFGDAAIRLGLLTDADVRGALARQYGYPYVKGNEESPLDRRVFAAYEPFERRTESLRSLRSQLLLRWFSAQRKVLAVVSPYGHTTSSILAANLAVIFAQLGEWTLLIDANMRSPMQHELFGIDDNEGLSAVLAARRSFKGALRTVAPFTRLSVLCAGARVPNPQELLSRDTFVSLIDMLPPKFGAVIVDTSPALESADAQIVAARAGGCLMVARRHHTRVRDLRRTAQLLAPSGATVVGVMISD